MCSVTSMVEQDTAQRWCIPTWGDQSKSSQKRRGADLCLPFNPTTLTKKICLLHILWTIIFGAVDILLSRLLQTFLYFFFSYSRTRRTHKHLFPCVRYFPALQMVQSCGSHRTAPSWTTNPYGRGSALRLLWENHLHDQGWFPNFYLTANTFGLERSLGMALIWPRGLGKELPTSSPVGVQPLLTVILNEHCPALNTIWQYWANLAQFKHSAELLMWVGDPHQHWGHYWSYLNTPHSPPSSSSLCPLLHTPNQTISPFCAILR